MSPVLCGADTPVRETPEEKRAKTMFNAIWPAITRSFELLAAALREIFDESAYQRFLDRSRLQSSTEAYATFQQENEQARSRRPRCC
jgi:hypothetical protein